MSPSTLMIALLLGIILSALVAAHDDSAFSDWYRSLKDGNGISCCSPNRDCNEVDSYKGTNEGYKVKYNGTWIDVPMSVVIYRTDNPTGRGVLCASLVDQKPVVRCFIRAAEG